MTASSRNVRTGCQSRQPRLLSDRSGTAGIEFAFVFPVFLAALFLTIEFARVMYSKVEFEYAVFNATRFGMVMKAADTATVKQALSNNLILLKPANLKDVTVTESANPDKTRTTTLTAAYQVDFLLPISSLRSVTLSRTVTFLRAQ